MRASIARYVDLVLIDTCEYEFPDGLPAVGETISIVRNWDKDKQARRCLRFEVREVQRFFVQHKEPPHSATTLNRQTESEIGALILVDPRPSIKVYQDHPVIGYLVEESNGNSKTKHE